MDIFNLLIYVSIALTLLFIYGLYKVLKPIKGRRQPVKKLDPHKSSTAPKLVVTSSDISAIAGDDVLATQLDLARAYIETGRHALAKKILEHVQDHGAPSQKDEAFELLKYI